MGRRRVVLATFPAQGHINPALQFAKQLLKAGADVTFFTSVYAWRRMVKTTSAAASPPGLDFVAFSDGYDEGLKPGGDGGRYMSEMKARGREALRGLLLNTKDVSFLVYSHLFAWAAEVAREVHVPSALLWVEPATVLCIYHFYFSGHAGDIDAGSDDIHLPNLPPLEQRDLPTFLLPATPERFRSMMREKLETLDGEEKAKVLVNTFDALEPDALTAIDRYELIGIGPLIPSAFLDGEDPSDTSFGGDLFEKSEDNCIAWLHAQPQNSVVYVSFGSVLNLPKAQMEEIGKGLLASNRPFLWMIREQKTDDKDVKEKDEELNCIRELRKLGKIVSWCPQLDILAHPSLGCFVTHCGWNSAIESLALGVPVVALPQWFDQSTNAKMVEDVWGTGVRVRVRVRVNEGGGVDGGEVGRCIEMVMDGGKKCKQVRENARKWKDLARESMRENGSSLKNLNHFLQQVVGV